MPRRLLWGLAYGLVVGGCVVILSTARYGFSAPLLVLGIVVLVGFGGFAFLGAFAARRRTLD